MEHNAHVHPDARVQSAGATVTAAVGGLLTGVLGFGLGFGAEDNLPPAVAGRLEVAAAPDPLVLSAKSTDADRSTDTERTGFSYIVGTGEGTVELRLFAFNSFKDALTLESTAGGAGKPTELGAGRGEGWSVYFSSEFCCELCAADLATEASGTFAILSTSTLLETLSALSAMVLSSPSSVSSFGSFRADLSRFDFGCDNSLSLHTT